MKAFDDDTLDRFDRGEVDFMTGLTAILDSGVLNLVPGRVGSFDWDDDVLGPQTFTGAGALLSIIAPRQVQGNEAQAITVQLAETYLPQGSTTPVNVFADDDRASIDEEPWQWREVIISTFWLSSAGVILGREQISRRLIDAMPQTLDEQGKPVRSAVLELPAIVQRDVEGKTHNAAFQALIDPDDRAFEHVAETATQRITLGAMPEQQVS